MRSPRVFLSSTFYDLKQIRSDLSDFVSKSLGYDVLASEHPSFPVDPDADTVENCRRRVEQEADMMVLVIGSRYGSIPEGKQFSVTNMEYSVARTKGIPVYAFAQKDVLANMPTWESNPDGEFSAIVDTPALFEFVKQIRDVDKVWTFPFETAQDIVEALRKQCAYLMSRGLDLLRRTAQLSPELKGLTGKAYLIALERSVGWQGLLFAELLRTQIEDAGHLRRAHAAGIALGPGDDVSEIGTPGWFKARLSELRRIADGFEKVLDQVVTSALNATDAREIRFAADHLAQVYREALEWSRRLRLANLSEHWQQLAEQTALFSADLIARIEELAPHLESEIQKAIAAPIGKTMTLDLELKVGVANIDGFMLEAQRIERKLGL